MPRGKLLDLKDKPEKKFPLIEILGPIDVGKTFVAQLVARRLGAPFIPFPVLDPSTITGRGLLASLTTMARSLETYPQWWAHIYAANLYEQKTRIEAALMVGPVVVTNYTTAFKIWMNLLGVSIQGYVTEMPMPNASFCLYGDPIVSTNRPKFDFSPEFCFRIKKSLGSLVPGTARRVLLTDFYSSYTHCYINNIVVAITENLRERFNCKVDSKELYSADCFLKKKDL